MQIFAIIQEYAIIPVLRSLLSICTYMKQEIIAIIKQAEDLDKFDLAKLIFELQCMHQALESSDDFIADEDKEYYNNI